MGEIIYSSESELRSPWRFVAGEWRDLRVAPPAAWRLFVRGLQASYSRSWLGYLWLLAPPLATAATWVYLHSANVLEVGPTRLPYTVFVLTGAVLWQVFAEIVKNLYLRDHSRFRHDFRARLTPRERFRLTRRALRYRLLLRFHQTLRTDLAARLRLPSLVAQLRGLAGRPQ